MPLSRKAGMAARKQMNVGGSLFIEYNVDISEDDISIFSGKLLLIYI